MHPEGTRGRGAAGESLAVAYLELAGLRVVARNRRIAGVEVDLVAVDRGTQVIVEVKYRSRSDYGGAAEALGHGQRQRLLRAAAALAQGPGAVRIDVVAIELEPAGLAIRHYRNAVGE